MCSVSCRSLAAAAMLALSLGLFPTTARAQSTIAGLVTDGTGAVLPGVTVEAASPAMIEKVRTAITDTQGRYTIVDVRPGEYSVTFRLLGFQTVRREGIQVAANLSVPINARLEVGAIEEAITVSGETPVVDVQQSGQRQVLDREILDALPSSRSYGNVGAVLPGMKLTGPVVGGTGTTVLQRYVTVRGKSGAENAMEVDGMDVRTIRGTHDQAYTNYAMAQEVTYQSNAISAETSGGGVRINMIPRDGGNRFTGDLFVGGMTSAWQSNNITPELKAAGLPTPEATEWIYEVNPAFGGPIIRDRLWFFVSGRLNRALLAPAGAQYADGTQGFNDTRTDNASGRLTWQATPRNKITAYLDESWRYQSHAFGTALTEWGKATTIWPTGEQWIGNVKWSSPISNKVLAEAGFGRHAYNMGIFEPQQGVLMGRGTPEWLANASRVDLVLGTTTIAANNNCCSYYNQPSYIWAGAVSYVTGSHSFKAGGNGRLGVMDLSTLEHNAALQQRYRNGLPDSVAVAAHPSHTKSEIAADFGVYAQDNWTIDRLTLNLGVRFEYFKGKIGATEMDAGRFVPARSVEELYPWPTFRDVTPRLGAVYDVFGNAKTAFKVSAGKYMSSLGATQVSLYNPISTTSDIRNWFDVDLVAGTSTPSGRILPTNRDNIAQENEIGPSNISNFGRQPDRRADPDLKREYNWDYSVSLQQELVPGISLTGAWYHTRFYNLQSFRNVLLNVSDYTPFQVPNPLTAGEMITVFNLDRAKQGQVDTVATASDVNRRTYNGFEVNMMARLPNGGTVLGGWFTERTVSITCDTNDPNQYRFCDQSGQLFQELGAVPSLPFRHEFKLAATYPFPWKLEASMSLMSYPGSGGITTTAAPAPYLAVDWVVPAVLFPGGRTQSVTVGLIPPGTEYLKRWNQLDMTVKRRFRVRRVEMLPAVEVYNLTNSSVVLNEVQTFGPSLGQPLLTLQGRMMRLGVQLRY